MMHEAHANILSRHLRYMCIKEQVKTAAPSFAAYTRISFEYSGPCISELSKLGPRYKEIIM